VETALEEVVFWGGRSNNRYDLLIIVLLIKEVLYI